MLNGNLVRIEGTRANVRFAFAALLRDETSAAIWSATGPLSMCRVPALNSLQIVICLTPVSSPAGGRGRAIDSIDLRHGSSLRHWARVPTSWRNGPPSPI
jgi:hypothetical protein